MQTTDAPVVFVYGTLKPGERAWEQFCAGRVVAMQPARVHGRLFHLAARDYPAMLDERRLPKTRRAKGWVCGWRLVLRDAATLAALDAWEEYDPARRPMENEYNRTVTQCFAMLDGPKRRGARAVSRHLGAAWVYVMGKQRIAAYGGVELPAGEWAETDFISPPPGGGGR